MAESVIRQIELPTVTIEDVFRAEGADYSKRPPRAGTLELHKRILAEAYELIKPTIIWREFEITDVGEQEILLKGGYKLTSKLLAKVSNKAEKLVIFAATVGNTFEKRVETYKEEGKINEAYTLDATGIAFLVKSIDSSGSLKKDYEQRGLKTTFVMGPGHSYWREYNDMKILFKLLEAERIGLRITDSNLLLPTKSLLLVMAVGSDLPDFSGMSHCDFCEIRAKCNMREFH